MFKRQISPTAKWTLLAITLLSAVYLLTIWLVQIYFYQYHCVVIRCEPASWATMKDLIFAHANNNGEEEQIVSITVFPRTKFESEELDYINVYISYIATSKTTNTPYFYGEQSRTVYFNDHVLWLEDDGQQEFVKDLPTIAFQEPLKNATIGPREAYRIVWLHLQKTPELVKRIRSVIGDLVLDQSLHPAKDNVLLWEFRFTMKGGMLTYRVNAETEEIILRQEENFK